ncbi:MAG: hypothetical protein IH850_09215 [Acidobacteria bacterium]|nr:hypothetical protein [Acidobacteriota bacterium]
MTIDELIREHADELRAAHAHRVSEVPARREWRHGWITAVGAAVVVVLLIAPVGLLLRSGSGAGLGEEQTATTAATSVPETSLPSMLAPPLVNMAELSEPLFSEEGDIGLRRVLETDRGFVVSGWFTTIWSNDGESWAIVGGAPDGDDSLQALAVLDGVAIGVGAYDGATARLYRSEDLGATWEIRQLPSDEGTVRTSGYFVSTDDSGFIISGVGTKSSFDSDVTLYLWKSPDGLDWTVDRVADMGGEFLFAESVTAVDGATVLLAQTFDDRLLAFEQATGEERWEQFDLTPVLADQAGITAELQNATLVGVHIVDGQLNAWWRFNNGNRGDVLEEAAAVVKRTGPGEWEAIPIIGLAPATVTSTSDGFVGTAHLDTELGTYPEGTSIVASADGVEWREIARFTGVALEALHETGPGEFIASGAETAINDEGHVYVTAGGVWKITLTDNLERIIQPDG